MPANLPIDSALPALRAALRDGLNAVLIAPPGAGKTTAVPPALLGETWCEGQIVMTSPRRVAARAAAERMAELIGERAGETIGYLTRLDSKQSARTRILVVTEAILVNRLLDDPELSDVSALLFDEAHERHLDGDLALALALESQAVLRPDLKLLVMSATIDGARFAGLLGSATPVIESRGVTHPLEIVWLGSPGAERIEDAMTAAVLTGWAERAGDILAFLPGVREIEQVRERLTARLPDTAIRSLHGQIDPAGQRAAVRRDEEGRRRIVLATSIAETSLTLDGVSVVIDSGLTRRAQYDRAAGTTHLVTQRASQAAAAQRAGRAARQGPGTAYRLWEEAAHAGRPAFEPPEITTADLTPLVLRTAKWGSADPAALPWLDPPPEASIAAARAGLQALGALDGRFRITARGQALAALPLEPALAAMVLFGAEHGAGETAARLALLLQERGLGGRGEDLEERLARWSADRSPRAEASRKLAAGWARKAGGGAGGGGVPICVLLAAGRPGFVAKRRDGSGESWLAAGGRGFALDPASRLARAEYLVIGDAQGRAKGARITAAAALTEADITHWLGDRIEIRRTLRWTGTRVEARCERRLGAIVLASGPDPSPDLDAVALLLRERALGQLDSLIPAALLARARFAGLTALELESLRERAEEWLGPLLSGRSDLSLAPARIAEALLNLLDWDERQKLDRLAPREFTSPAGTAHAIDYIGDDAPSAEVRVQALFGLDRHPMVGDTPLLLKLTSPAGRPVQATRDLPGFWRGSWAEVRKEMKGRYPKHRWPDAPWSEVPSLKTKNAFQRAPG
ncbi:ATP-dependent helicase HrpB [Qipengyuania sediminis]|uniref:ATP-dependent helicase HrpB n=1 Tax=Qipengyuania sediminis TaxID=1532023 RepID=UPI001F0D4FCD|nr:ATP-dependent helicase HrpB [Qipengyuania sediminis]